MKKIIINVIERVEYEFVANVEDDFDEKDDDAVMTLWHMRDERDDDLLEVIDQDITRAEIFNP